MIVLTQDAGEKGHICVWPGKYWLRLRLRNGIWTDVEKGTPAPQVFNPQLFHICFDPSELKPGKKLMVSRLKPKTDQRKDKVNHDPS